MANPIDIAQNFSTTLNVGGGIDNSQTSGIVLTSVTGLPTDGGILCFNWSSTLDTDVAEYIEYTGISGNTLTGVTRGVEGFSAKAHSNGATVVGVVSRAHIKRLRDKLTGNDATALQDPNANEILKTAYEASAVNEVTVTNAATGNAPIIEATGGDTNIDLKLLSKGSGALSVAGTTDYENNVTDDDDIPNKAYVDSNSSTSILDTTKYGPEGFLINGKIVTSNLANSNTIAIKGMDGNDPSSSNPVYVRIEDTVRTLTSALSVSTVSGQGHFNENAAKIEDKDTDYFVYLFWKAGDSSLVIGVSRIPYGRLYSEFSGTNGNEKYLLPSASLASSDRGVVIGRVNMTCASTTAYWSIPATSVIIPRPIFHTRWLSYSPSLTWDGTPPSSVNATKTYYRINGENLELSCHVAYSSGGTGNTSLTVSIPFSEAETYYSWGPQGFSTASGAPGFGVNPSCSTQPRGSTLRIFGTSTNANTAVWGGTLPIKVG